MDNRERVDDMRRIINLFMCIGLCILLCAGSVKAATPRVMVSDYSVKGGTVIAGKEFELTITLKNTSPKTLKNAKLSIRSENGELLPENGAGTAYVEQMDPDSEVELKFDMKAANGLEEKSYKLDLKTEYENTGGWEYTVEETIFIPVKLEQRLSVTDIYLPETSVDLGETVEISASVNNLGAGTLYNVSARVMGDNVMENSTYVGNIESGKSGTIDLLTKSTKIVSPGDVPENLIYISYEDKEGNIYEEQRMFDIDVTEPVYENLEKVKESDDYSKEITVALKVLAGILVVGVLVFLGIKRKKHKEQMLEEFMK